MATPARERLTRLAVLDCPHPVVMRRHLLRNASQRRRSWYFFLFHLPWLPERKLRRTGYRAIRSIFAQTSYRRGSTSCSSPTSATGRRRGRRPTADGP